MAAEPRRGKRVQLAEAAVVAMQAVEELAVAKAAAEVPRVERGAHHKGRHTARIPADRSSLTWESMPMKKNRTLTASIMPIEWRWKKKQSR